MSDNTSYPKVKIQGNTIINHEGYAVEFEMDAHGLISDCLILTDYAKFWHDPLLWIAVKIIKWKYYKLFNSSPTTMKEGNE